MDELFSGGTRPWQPWQISIFSVIKLSVLSFLFLVCRSFAKLQKSERVFYICSSTLPLSLELKHFHFSLYVSSCPHLLRSGRPTLSLFFLSCFLSVHPFSATLGTLSSFICCPQHCRAAPLLALCQYLSRNCPWLHQSY